MPGTGLLVVLAAYAAMSAVAFAAFWRDKRAATRGRRRTPEATLHLLELLGGWPGALAARRVLRHKSAKRSYAAVLWLVVLLHAAAWAGVAWWRLRGGAP
ncbi:MAG: DUF1294 domain-containing protein [Planctomycetota bacterium]|jgi:uncharacterized membrane protein YsdA (DUF1294 family)